MHAQGLKNPGKVLMRGITQVDYATASGREVATVDVSAAGITNVAKVVESLVGTMQHPHNSNKGCSVELTNATTLQIIVGHSNAGSTWVCWEIREAKGNVMRGRTAVTASTSTYVYTSATLTGTTSSDKIDVYDNGEITAASQTPAGIGYGTRSMKHLASATELRLYFGTYGWASTIYVMWAVDIY